MGTDIGADGSDHIISLDHFHGLFITALKNEAYIASGIGAHRASGSAWRQQLFPALGVHHYPFSE
jgi:hypothetical protein